MPIHGESCLAVRTGHRLPVRLVASVPSAWLVTAKPMGAFEGITIVWLVQIWVQARPLVE
jgi:hypothetical protein